MLGSTLFVGINHIDCDGSLLGREQVFGTVESVSRRAGITLVQRNGETYTLSPLLDAIEVGGTEQYQLSSEDELVENPDFVAWVDAIRPDKH